MNIEEDSLETKVCTSYDEQVRTVLLLSKAGYSQTNPDQTFIAEIANLNLQNVESYFISPIEFNFINIQELGQLISTVNKWHGIILTSIRCVDALIQSFNLLSEREIILAKWQQSTIFTVGDATKQYLLDKLHLDSIGHQSSNSETLAKFILDLNREQPIKLPLLYPCSNIRSESISKSLQGIILLHEVVCYETIPNQHLEQEMKMFRQHIDRKLQSLDEIHLKNCKLLLIVVFFSPSGVMNLFPHICRDLLSLNNTLVVKFVAFGNVTAAKMTDLGIEEDVKSAYRIKLESWLNKNMKIKMSDNRTIVGIFLCTDCHRNIILGSSLEYLKDDENEEPRILGLAMIPGAHIVSIHIDEFMDKSTGSRINDSS